MKYHMKIHHLIHFLLIFFLNKYFFKKLLPNKKEFVGLFLLNTTKKKFLPCFTNKSVVLILSILNILLSHILSLLTLLLKYQKIIIKEINEKKKLVKKEKLYILQYIYQKQE